jgi:hypothetical protein
MQFTVPDWVPESARRKINELHAAPWVNDKGRALLHRLATDYAMKTEVWQKLPSEPKGAEGELIERVANAVWIFPKLRRPYPKTAGKWREWAKHLEHHAPLPDPAHASSLALELWLKISELKPDTDATWNRLWGGDKSINADLILAILDQLRVFYLRLDDEYRTLIGTYPRVKRWSGSKAAQNFLPSTYRVT